MVLLLGLGVDYLDFVGARAAELPLVVLNALDGRVEGKRAMAQLFQRRRNVRRGHFVFILLGYNGYK